MKAWLYNSGSSCIILFPTCHDPWYWRLLLYVIYVRLCSKESWLQTTFIRSLFLRVQVNCTRSVLCQGLCHWDFSCDADDSRSTDLGSSWSRVHCWMRHFFLLPLYLHWSQMSTYPQHKQLNMNQPMTRSYLVPEESLISFILSLKFRLAQEETRRKTWDIINNMSWWGSIYN